MNFRQVKEQTNCVLDDFMGNQRKIGELNTQIEVEKEVQQGKREALYQTNSAQGKFDEEIKR